MIKKSRIVGLLLVVGVGFLVLRSGDEPSDSRDRGSEPGSATDPQFQPREPAVLAPESDYGIAGRPGVQEARPTSDGPSDFPRQPYSQRYSSEYGTPRAYGGGAPVQTNGYRFRPLSEQEQRRMQPSRTDGYRPPRYSAQSAPQQGFAPAPYPETSVRPNRQQEIYSFRPLERSRAPRGRWQGPYQQPGWRDDRRPIDPWTAPPDPQWGSTPPAQRMYPSYSRNTSRRVSAR